PLDPSIINTFTVQAFDASGNVSAGDPTAQIVLDNTPPTWPAASALEATVGADAVTFVWTAAIDDVGVDRYVLFEDALPVATVDGSTLTLALQLSGVSANAGHTFEIQALDRAGNASTDGPTAHVYIDRQPPTWPAGSLLSAAPTGAHTAHLVWTS